MYIYVILMDLGDCIGMYKYVYGCIIIIKEEFINWRGIWRGMVGVRGG